MPLKSAIEFGETTKWHRLEVTTLPLPEFERTLQFYESNKFKISGGRKLMVEINEYQLGQHGLATTLHFVCVGQLQR